MIEESTIKKVLAIFFENPTRKFHLRELSRISKLSLPTILSSTEKLFKENLIIREKGKVITLVYANRENINFLRKKRLYNLKIIYDSGIIEEVSKLYNHPQNIVLFGSFSRGEDIESSDIDLAIITPKKMIFKKDKYEKYLKRKISLHEIKNEEISIEFLSNLHNGIILEGFW